MGEMVEVCKLSGVCGFKDPVLDLVVIGCVLFVWEVGGMAEVVEVGWVEVCGWRGGGRGVETGGKPGGTVGG